MKLTILALVAFAPGLSLAQMSNPSQAASPAPDGSTEVTVTFTGGHDTDPRDHGRPVILVASALNVPPEVFREAFSHVKPAGPDHPPEPDQVRKNKAALLDALGKYGVDNDRLDTVSNYYRYKAWAGDLWRTTPATATATVSHGVVTGFTVTNPGSGYSSSPQVSVPGIAQLNTVVKLSFSTDFKKNGSIQEITLAPPGSAPESATVSGPPASPAANVSSFTLTSPVVTDGGQLPVDYTGDGTASTLPLAWSGTPAGTKSYALIMHHIDRDGVTKWYWTLYNIPPEVTSLPKNVTGVGTLGNNSVNPDIGYAPPHSKGPGPRTYVLTLYALSEPLQISLPAAQVSRAVLLDAMQGKVLASSALHVVYTRS